MVIKSKSFLFLVASLAVSSGVFAQTEKGNGQSQRYQSTPLPAYMQAGAVERKYQSYRVPSYTGADTNAYKFRMTLKRSIEMMFPPANWTVIISPTLNPDEVIEWHQGRHETAISALAQQNNLVVITNKETGIVGIAKTDRVAKALASGDGQSWFVEAPSTMKKVLEKWVQQAGYNGLDWLPTQDYEILYPAVILGDVQEAVTQLLRSVAGERLPLQASLTANNVIQIKQGGWQAP